MKRINRLLYILLAGLMALSLTACGEKEKTVQLTYEDAMTTMEYELTAKEDIVEKISQRSTTNISMYDSSQANELIDSTIKPLYDGIEGVVFSAEISGDYLVETLEIDATNQEALRLLSSRGVLRLDGEPPVISLEKTIDNLTSQGWVLEE